ncbi:uncharacterized protein Tco025E_02117 [Trypanosoma conorhini]|uniref:Uncharacterized protein n=1 Tax=Trypanosoma conorhini TaxID=83891 RepID=A0A3R7PV36_9TRYP|nr:uncharacterized protein Tco025E_02117 [Trypanosoma conorhini]RNF25621.1 hypothetical protein Tco025E_02117 [Trypanosoma conorhini]
MSSGKRGTSPSPSAAAAAAQGKSNPAQREILQTARLSLELTRADDVWSSWYKESEDQFADFQSFGETEGGPNAPAAAGPNAGSGGAQFSSSHRTLSARRVSGLFEEEVLKSWDEDWEDEDVEDTFDAIMGQIGRYEALRAASAPK